MMLITLSKLKNVFFACSPESMGRFITPIFLRSGLSEWMGNGMFEGLDICFQARATWKLSRQKMGCTWARGMLCFLSSSISDSQGEVTRKYFFKHQHPFHSPVRSVQHVSAYLRIIYICSCGGMIKCLPDNNIRTQTAKHSLRWLPMPHVQSHWVRF